MRIIAGEFKGRNLLGPASDVTRPVTDRVKQSVFDILTPYLQDAVVYDCFAGTGSMGLECLSRGAKHVTFFEADQSAAKRLRRNIETISVQKHSTVVTSDLFKWFHTSKNQQTIDLVFLDPPYRFLNEKPHDLQALSVSLQTHHLKPDGIVIFRHDTADTLHFQKLPLAEQRSYGSMTVEFLRPLATNSTQPTTSP